ncbi:hypothetical protein D3C84_880270 [compost metagenome]
MARMRVQFSSALPSLSAALVPRLRWSSCRPEVTKLSTTAGCASWRFSPARAAATYWAIIIPELTPGWLTRKAGRRLTSGLTRRSRRRSAMPPSSATAMASRSAAMATDSPWGLAWDTTR